jgi:hypothetical protein
LASVERLEQFQGKASSHDSPAATNRPEVGYTGMILSPRLWILGLGALCAVAQAAAPVSVMIVGVVHFGNPARDLHDVTMDDVLSPKRQVEIQNVIEALARFHPTRVMVEDDQARVDARYDQFRKGTLSPSRNEEVQLGFRLAKRAGLLRVDGIDVEGDFPYPALQAYAHAHGQTIILNQVNAGFTDQIAKIDAARRSGTIADLLIYMNRPSFVRDSQAPYRLALSIGNGSDQPAAELLTAWYRRNFAIEGNIAQRAQSGDHIVIFYGFGHAFLLRQFVSEMPGYRLVELSDYISP